LQKLNEKGQSAEKQKQASQSVKVYIDIIVSKTEPGEKPKGAKADNSIPDAGKDASGWSAVFKTINEAIRLRNYSKKTFRTCSSWIYRFTWFVKNKNPEEVVIDDVKQFLTDLEENYLGVFMPSSVGRKYPGQARDFSWQWFFPAKALTLVPEEGGYRRYHLHETHVQKAIRSAVLRCQLTKRATAHTFRHSFASHLLQANYDIRTIQKMLGHSDVRTTMIYTNTVRSRTLQDQKSPLGF